MNNRTANVDWNRYAQKYDMLIQFNPFYQNLQRDVLERTSQWEISPGDVIADIGAGTGNYSVGLASQFTHAQVWHVDRDPGMCAVAREKFENRGLENFKIQNQAVEELAFAPQSLKACLCIHSLYTFPDPAKLLQQIHGWLKPGGYGIFVDPGRIVRVREWQLAIGWQMIRKYGLVKTLQVMREGKEISKQNRQISKYQVDGTYWTHTPEQFRQAVTSAGFKIIESRLCFRGISDMAVAVKEAAPVESDSDHITPSANSAETKTIAL